jgi:hypothetical protein
MADVLTFSGMTWDILGILRHIVDVSLAALAAQ